VIVSWSATCTKNGTVTGRSGQFQNTTPINDGTSIVLPVSAVAECTIAVGATLGDSGGSLSLSVYSSQG